MRKGVLDDRKIISDRESTFGFVLISLSKLKAVLLGEFVPLLKMDDINC